MSSHRNKRRRKSILGQKNLENPLKIRVSDLLLLSGLELSEEGLGVRALAHDCGDGPALFCPDGISYKNRLEIDPEAELARSGLVVGFDQIQPDDFGEIFTIL